MGCQELELALLHRKDGVGCRDLKWSQTHNTETTWVLRASQDSGWALDAALRWPWGLLCGFRPSEREGDQGPLLLV